MRMKNDKSINITLYKLLLTIDYLNELGYTPSVSGVLKIITGVIDEETDNFTLCPTFQTLVSYGSKRLSRDINTLVSYGYLQRIHKEEYSDYFFIVSESGKAIISYFKAHHKISLTKHEIKKKPTIIKRVK